MKCVRLYRAIICRAIADAYGKTGLEDPSERRTCIREAREFFWRQDEWFTFLFEHAGIDPEPIIPFMLGLSPVEFQVPPRKAMTVPAKRARVRKSKPKRRRK